MASNGLDEFVVRMSFASRILSAPVERDNQRGPGGQFAHETLQNLLVGHRGEHVVKASRQYDRPPVIAPADGGLLATVMTAQGSDVGIFRAFGGQHRDLRLERGSRLASGARTGQVHTVAGVQPGLGIDQCDDAVIADANNYVIFRYGLTLFGTFECDDIEQVYRVMKSSEVFVRWGKFNEAIMKTEINPDTGYPYLLPVMWDFPG
jgi:hypothetical protein